MIKLYVVPLVKPETTVDVAGDIELAVVTFTKVPTPAAGAVPLADVMVGVPVE